MALEVGETVFIKATLKSLPDRMDNCKVVVKNTSGKETVVECSGYKISTDKPSTDLLLQVLKTKYEELIHDTSESAEVELITKAYCKFADAVRFHQ